MPEPVNADFVVRRGEGERLRLELRLGGKEFPLGMEAGRAGEVGRAMLAGAAVARSEASLAPEAAIESCIFPVEEWWTGTSNTDGSPMLILAVAGGVRLAFRFGPRSADQCGTALVRTAAQVSSQGLAQPQPAPGGDDPASA